MDVLHWRAIEAESRQTTPVIGVVGDERLPVLKHLELLFPHGPLFIDIEDLNVVGRRLELDILVITPGKKDLRLAKHLIRTLRDKGILVAGKTDGVVRQAAKSAKCRTRWFDGTLWPGLSGLSLAATLAARVGHELGLTQEELCSRLAPAKDSGKHDI